MRDTEVPVTLQPPGRTVHVLRGTTLLEAAAEAGVVIDTPCGGEGTCGKCRVTVRHGACEPKSSERQLLAPAELEAGVRLACQATVAEPTVLKVPVASQPAVAHQILAEASDLAPGQLDPPVRKRYVELPPPRRGDDAPDPLRLERVLGLLRVDLDLLGELPGRLRQCGFRGTAVTTDSMLVDFEPGDTQSQCYAVAVDVGTTTLAAALCDMASGQTLGVASRLNPQTQFGDDVLARILYASRQPDGLARLHRAVVEAIEEMIDELVGGAGVARRHVYEVCFSGNTTMQQVLCRVDPQPLGELPFTPGIGRLLEVRAAELGFALHPRARAVVLPVIGGFVGGDTVAGILITALADAPGPTLLVDIGTNGEIVLAAGGKLAAASTAAGPAFEGARIACGMRGSTGAIEKVLLDGCVRMNVIGGVAPLGICGSGLIDLAAELLNHGLMASDGRLLPRERLPAGVPDALARCVVPHNNRPAFLLASAEESGTGRPILLSQQDVRELQLATGAIRAGIEILLRRAGLSAADLENVFVAGGFGNFIRRSNAQRIGLLPHGVPHQRIRYRGNTSLAGAQWVALSQTARRLADDLARRTEHVDLGSDPGFQTAFAEAMIFPDGGEERERHEK